MKQLLSLLFCVLAFNCSNAQNIAGIGAQLFLDTADGYTMPRIQALIPNTPAYQYLNATDYIIKVNGVDCKNKSMEAVVGMIRGEAGTMVKVTTSGNKDGKDAKDFDLQRVGMQVPGGNASPPDPSVAFYTDCENEVKLLRTKNREIVKTYSSDCGDFFFNFNAEKGPYHVRVITMGAKVAGATSPGYSASAKVFDGDNEATARPLDNISSKDGGVFTATSLEGTISFTKTSVGTISIQVHDDVKKCHGIYVIVYQ